ncbi:MAG: hypothetical protein A2Z34_07475 [Planctomycetes bacterium RBG_16_59_8]|nr:MAG: hypothetical protein A2Z34_07475 [Planctomycetes bacterium RBG_16_59_8]
MCAVKLAENDGSGNYTIRFSHDIDDGTNKLIYPCVLPKLRAKAEEKTWEYHPGGKVVTLSQTGDPALYEAEPAFNLGTDPWIAKAVLDTKHYDPSEPYGQYMFALAFRKIDTFEYDGAMPLADKEKKTRLYECRIILLRKGGPPLESGTGVPKQFLDEFTCKFSVR